MGGMEEGGDVGKTNSDINYSAATEIASEDNIIGGQFSSENPDENAILVSGENKVSLNEISVVKTGDSDGGDDTSFYGINSAILAKNGANLTIKNATIETNATGANGVFSYGGTATTASSNGDDTTIVVSDSKITTKKDNSGGIMTTGGGVMMANDLEISTSGTSSTAIRTDRGGGTVIVNGGTYTTTGQGSPTIYSTADVTVKNAKLVATNSEGVVVEGKNSVVLENCELDDTNKKLNGQSTTYKNIFLYQSMSGDADSGTASFTAKNNTITTNKGDSFYVTNTSATINLSGNTIVNNDNLGAFLRIQADSWGKSGSNGGEVELNFDGQEAEGEIVVDEISTLEINLTNESSFSGVINSENSAKKINLKIDKTSKIKLTDDWYISSFENENENNSNIDFNGHKIFVDGAELK